MRLLDKTVFPGNAAEFDHALVMRDMPHEWRKEPDIQVESKN